MRKVILFGIVMAMSLGLVACASKGNEAEVKEAVEALAQEEEETKEELEEAAESVEEAKEELEEIEADVEEAAKVTEEEEKMEEIVYTQEELEKMNAVEFAAVMRAGWNLGNTLDATDGKGLDSETSWFQPKTTQELISYVKEVGFTSIRIPVSWGNHVDENYQIDPEWMDRVKEVVDYAYNENMYVIINSHHDNDFYYPSEENLVNGKKYIATIWEQIAEEFKDYDNHLVFESMNEPRLAGTDIEWWFAMADPEGKAAIGRICELNQVFVDTVRAAGGNNPVRFIMVPSYAANPDFALNSSFSMPEDPAGDKLMLSVHAYTPYDFAGNANGYSDWDGSKNHEFNFMGKLKAMFVNEGYGVVIGEFGATNKGNDEDRVRWAKGYCQKAGSFGMSYFVWDNGATGVGEENFGVIDRTNLKLYFPEVFDAYMSGFDYYKP